MTRSDKDTTLFVTTVMLAWSDLMKSTKTLVLAFFNALY